MKKPSFIKHLLIFLQLNIPTDDWFDADGSCKVFQLCLSSPYIWSVLV